MKLKLLVGSLLLAGFLAGSASAQGVHAGLEAGSNFSSFIGSDASVENLEGSRLGGVGGFFLDLGLSKSFSIRPELLYAQKGGQDTNNNTYQFDYLELPVLLKMSLGTPGINPGILIGPTFNLNTVAQVEQDGVTGSFDGLSSFDLGIMGGVEVDFDKFFVTGRYEVGLNDVENNSSQSIQNGTLTFMAGYSFL